MPATCHRVVGIIDVEADPDFILQMDAPLQANTSHAAHPAPRFFTTAKLNAELQQLAADLKIEYQCYQRRSARCGAG